MKLFSVNRILFTALICFLFVQPILVKPQKAFSASGKEAAEIIFTEIEKRLIQEFFSNQPSQTPIYSKSKKQKSKKGLPPGLAKKKSLPPGLQKQLERNGQLPPGLSKRQLPSSLNDQLPLRSEEFERVIVEDNVLLMKRGTNLIYDIIKDVMIK